MLPFENPEHMHYLFAYTELGSRVESKTGTINIPVHHVTAADGLYSRNIYRTTFSPGNVVWRQCMQRKILRHSLKTPHLFTKA